MRTTKLLKKLSQYSPLFYKTDREGMHAIQTHSVKPVLSTPNKDTTKRENY
jgi:hypothetical protein